MDGVVPQRVKLEHVHAACSAWFDRTGLDHVANEKPYAVSPLTEHTGRVGVEIATLSGDAAELLALSTAPGTTVRLGAQVMPVGEPILMHADSWSELDGAPPQREWTLEFVTPTTFRSGDRSSPLPAVATVMAGLARSWSAWSGLPERTFDPRTDRALWVSDLDLRSTVLPLTVRTRSDGNREIHLSGVLGTMTLRCDDAATALRVGPLIRLAPYAGVGSMRQKGLGVARLHGSRPVGPVPGVAGTQGVDGGSAR